MTPFESKFYNYKGPFTICAREHLYDPFAGKLVYLLKDDSTVLPAFRLFNCPFVVYGKTTDEERDMWSYLFLNELTPLQVQSEQDLEVYKMLYPEDAQFLQEVWDNGDFKWLPKPESADSMGK